MIERIYLDHNATTGLDEKVVESMLKELTSLPANPSSLHWFGRKAKAKLENARETIAHYLDVKPQEILFTSGGTESMNFLIRSCFKNSFQGHILSSNVEHACVYETLLDLKGKGVDVEFLPAGLKCTITPQQIQEALRPSTRLIVLSYVNSETGVKSDVEAIAKIAAQANVPFFVDAVALLGKEKVVIPSGVSAMGFSGHKLHGPKGTGFVFLRSRKNCYPSLTGGPQEFHLRAGTENLAGIVGLAKAVELLFSLLTEATERMTQLRDQLETELIQKAAPVVVNGHHIRVCNTTNLSFPQVKGEDLLIALDMAGIAASHGSACSSGAMEPSRVLTQMGLPPAITQSAIRFSLGRHTSQEEINHAIQIITKTVASLRKR